MGPYDWFSPEGLRPFLDLPAFGITDGTVNVSTDQVGLKEEMGHSAWTLPMELQVTDQRTGLP